MQYMLKYLLCAFKDGNLRVFKWPAMESILSEVVDNTCIKDLDFRYHVSS